MRMRNTHFKIFFQNFFEQYIRTKTLATTNRDYIKNTNKVLQNKLKQDKINNGLKKLGFKELAKNNINQDDLVKIKQYNALNLKTIQKIAQERNINTTGLKKKKIIYTLIRSE